MFRDPKLISLLALTLALASACKASPSALVGTDAGPQDMSDAGSGADAGSSDEYPASGKATLRFKRSERIRNDFAQALSLDKASMCKELGVASCTDAVHNIALGGVEPYVLGVLEPLQFTTITTPIAIERVAFAACTQRVTQDLAAGDGAVIFKGLGLDKNGAIPSIDADGVASSIATLYQRTIQRDPLPSEVQHLKDLYQDVAATNEPQPGRDWAILSCFSVITTMEALFY